MNGNFVLNSGPDGLGNMHPGEDVIAKELGEWMKVNGKAVHAVRHADFPKTNYGYYTQKGKTLYLTVVNRSNNGVIRIPVIKNSKEVPVNVLILGSSFTDLLVKHADIGYDLDKNTYYDVIIPKEYNSDRAFVLKMQLGEPRVNSSKLMDAKM